MAEIFKLQSSYKARQSQKRVHSQFSRTVGGIVSGISGKITLGFTSAIALVNTM